MDLSSLIDPRLVQIDVDVSTIDAAIEKALENISRVYAREIRHEEVLARVRERQKLGGTAYESGIAIPHARIPSFNDFLIAPIVPKHPIVQEIGAKPAVPIRIVYLIIISNTVSTLYLNTLAVLVESSRNETLMASLLKAESGSRFVEEFEKAQYVVKKELTVSDIMTKNVISIRHDATIKELIDLMYSHHLRYVPIVAEGGKFVGEVGIIDLIKAGVPDYAFRIGSLSFLSELEPMTELLSRESITKVESIMSKNPPGLTPSTSVIEVAFLMARNVKRHYVVLDGGEIVGVISAMDILNKIIRA
jgi:CBS domain-containing protein